MSDDLISRKAVIEAVDRHTREDGTLDDDISIILEEVETAFDKGSRAYRQGNRKGAERDMGEVIAFFAGAVVGMFVMAIVAINRKTESEDDEQ